MQEGPLRWATSEGVFLFQVPDKETILKLENTLLLSSSLFAISVFLEMGEIKFNNEQMTIIRINFHPPFSETDPTSKNHFVIHSSYKNGFCFQSIFKGDTMTNEQSDFEKVFLDSVVNNILDKLEKENREVSDIPYLKDRVIINEVEAMLHEIDAKYKSLVASWSLAMGDNSSNSRYNFFNVYYNGKIQVSDLLYDLGDRALETINQIINSNEEKMVLYKIAKSLVSLSSILYEDEVTRDNLNFSHSEIILEGVNSKKLYRLDVRSYEIEDEQFCDITIMG